MKLANLLLPPRLHLAKLVALIRHQRDDIVAIELVEGVNDIDLTGPRLRAMLVQQGTHTEDKELRSPLDTNRAHHVCM